MLHLASNSIFATWGPITRVQHTLLISNPSGTHDIVGVVTSKAVNNAFVVSTAYSNISTARGAMYSFVFINDSCGNVDFSRSFLLALDRNTSHNHTLRVPFRLYPGHYRVHVYDIEHDGMLNNGVGYPAVTKELFTNLPNGNITTVDRLY